MEILAIIPARGSSKRFPRKNLALFRGESLLARTINQAKESKHITRIVVTTDDEEIAEVAKQNKVYVIKRPIALAKGEVGSMIKTIQHTLETLRRNEDYKAWAVVLLQVTSPLRTADDIDGTIALMKETKTDSAISVSLGKMNYAWEDYWSPLENYPENGAIFVSRYYVMKEYGKVVNTNSLVLYHMPVERSIDINTKEDLEKYNVSIYR